MVRRATLLSASDVLTDANWVVFSRTRFGIYSILKPVTLPEVA